VGTVGWVRVNKQHPCPLCGRTHYCSVAPDGRLVICTKVESRRPTSDGVGWLHRITQSSAKQGGQPTNGNGASHARVPTTRYAIKDEDGQSVAVHCRRDGPDGKIIWWETPAGAKGLGGLKPTELPLYRSEALGGLVAGATVFVTEGEKAADALVSLGLVAVGTVTGAATIPCEDALRDLCGYDAVLWPDNDEPGRKHMRRIADVLANLHADPRILTWPDAPDAGDAADFVAAGLGKDELRALYAAAQVVTNADPVLEPEPEPATPFPLTDIGNAQRLEARHGRDILWCDGMGRWLHWTGLRWEQTGQTILIDLAKDTALAIDDEAKAESDPDRKIALFKWAKASGSGRAVAAMVALTKTVTGGLAVEADHLDADPMLLGVENGTVDLRTGRLRPPERADLITKSCRAPFDPDAACPRWERFLADVFAGDAEVIAYVQRAAGYSLTGKISERVIFIEHGSGANGKTTFIEVLAHILGTYAMSTPIETLIVRKDPGISNDIARLKSARFVSSVESERGAKLAEAKIKQITGGDRLAARFLHQEYFEFIPSCKVWIATNHRPEIASGGKAIWKRVRLIPFEVEFTDEQIDPAIKAKLLDEVAGILAWAVRGCLEWQRIGLKEPASIRAANARYEEDEDVLGSFLEDRAIVEPNVWVSTADLYAEFESWRDAHGEDRLSAKAFSQAMAERSGIKRSRQGSGGTRGFSGVRLPERRDPKTRKRQEDGLDD
jgi:putative DNA primase/helicase